MANNKSTVSGCYILIVGIISFFLAAFFYVVSHLISQYINNILLSLIFLLIVIILGIISDLIGTSAAAGSETMFHSRASKRIPGAREGVYLVRNADRVANIANDVIGDIAGTVSGAIGISLVFQIVSSYPQVNEIFVTMITTALIASLTVGGKAFGKKLALSRGNDIIFVVGQIIAYLRNFKFINVFLNRQGK
ncbi:MAG: hypothetical protein K9L17_00570 [Clostridiales bacterium]|nr:hypothetical protein [Clostridiales bacterium]MCF8021185.1 hypothetical protein [Clostridiales bacterium]